MTTDALANVRFGDNGLIPVVAQDAASGDVLMLAFMNEEALRRTRLTGRAHYWSRGRNQLWRKGETSGNVQQVEDIRINCEQNSLLLLVRQTGAVCHEGYDTCYYRTLADDGSLQIVRERVFDPASVYGVPESPNDPLALASRLQFGAYEYLRDHDLGHMSGTSRRLRDGTAPLGPRVADELEELAGVLDGSHGHTAPEDDLVLESSQVIYWILLAVIRAGGHWDDLRPDHALMTAESRAPRENIAEALLAAAQTWRASTEATAETDDVVQAAQASMALVGAACLAGGLTPLAAIEADLGELRTRSYLAPYFAPEAT